MTICNPVLQKTDFLQVLVSGAPFIIIEMVHIEVSSTLVKNNYFVKKRVSYCNISLPKSCTRATIDNWYSYEKSIDF